MKLRILIRVELGFSGFIGSLIFIWFLVVHIVAYIRPLITLGRCMHHTGEIKREKL